MRLVGETLRGGLRRPHLPRTHRSFGEHRFVGHVRELRPVGWWRMGALTGDIPDLGSLGNPMSVDAGVSRGQLGLLNADADLAVTFPTGGFPTPTTIGTIDAGHGLPTGDAERTWIAVASSAVSVNNQGLLGMGTGATREAFGFQRSTSNQQLFVFTWNDDKLVTLPFGGALNDGVPHVFAVTYDPAGGVTNGLVAIYVDGILVDSYEPSGPLATADSAIVYGSAAPAASTCWDGMGDDLIALDYALTNEEQASLYATFIAP